LPIGRHQEQIAAIDASDHVIELGRAREKGRVAHANERLVFWQKGARTARGR
jgi:hypothetical protein